MGIDGGGCEKEEQWTRVIQQAGGGRGRRAEREEERKVKEDKWMEREMDIRKK